MHPDEAHQPSDPQGDEPEVTSAASADMLPPSFAVPDSRGGQPTGRPTYQGAQKTSRPPTRRSPHPARASERAARSEGRNRSLGWRVGRVALEFLAVFGIAAIIALGLRAFVVQVYKIPSESMLDTLSVGSRIAVNNVPGLGKDIERGDVVVFRDSEGWLEPVDETNQNFLNTVAGLFGFAPQGSQQIVVKRVIGVGGDTVTCCDEQGRISVNGIPIDETYLAAGAVPSTAEFSVQIPDGTYWVMGDNRQDSADSAYHYENGDSAFIPEASVIGRAQWVIWPLSDWSYLGNRDVFSQVSAPSDQTGQS
ncbi:signal peptidase I [Actinomyces minihominis]|uniref:signal peptidase I n=1 Tax=Actinomyces minihominis TaxID=2002838 RepID=UPI000C07FC7D|nr:signal peptidase I [Actinomyces minihominis]